MRVLVGAVALIVAAGSLSAGSASQRYVPFKLVAGGERGIDMNEGHPAHADLYVVANRKGLSRVSGVVNPEDWQAVRQVNLRKSIITVAASDFSPVVCPKNLTIHRVRVHRGRLDVQAVVEVGPSCSFIPETQGVHLYSVAAFKRSSLKKAPRPANLRLTFKDGP